MCVLRCCSWICHCKRKENHNRRKWLPQPLRKLSQGKVEKQSSTAGQDQRTTAPLKKTSSDKRFKLPANLSTTEQSSEEDDQQRLLQQRLQTSTSAPRPLTTTSHNGSASGVAPEDPEDETLELPPPMKPIQDPTLVGSGSTVAGGTGSTSVTPSHQPVDENGKRSSSLSLKALDGTSVDISEIEQIVKERMEQHSENLPVSSTKSLETTLEVAEDGVLNNESGTGGSQDNEIIDVAGSLKKRDFVLKELVQTEEAYVNDLSQIVDGYMAHMRDPECDIVMPEDLRGGKDKMIFGNVEAIYEWHREFFLKALTRCRDNPQDLGPLFKRYERKLHMYVVYCQNKPVSEHIVSEYMDTYFEDLRQKMGHKLQLCDLLIKPVQRIMKYQLLLKDIYKHTERAGLLQETESLKHAMLVMQVVPKAANDMMDVGRLQKFDGKITAQGKLLLHGPLLCWDTGNERNSLGGGLVGAGNKPKEYQVFLFEQSIIFSEAVGKKTQFTNPAYIYKMHIQVNKMSLEETVDDSADLPRFILRSTDPSRPVLGLSCTAQTQELRTEWVRTITSILQTQKDFLMAIQSPIAYQKELTKDVSMDATNFWNPTLRKTMSVPSGITNNKENQKKLPQKSITICESLDNSSNNNHLAAENQINRMQSPTKMKNFLEGFRNTLRTRRSIIDEDGSNGNTTEEPKKSLDKEHLGPNPRRWSETNNSNMGADPPLVMAPGTPARLLHDCGDLQQDEVVHIIRYDSVQGYLVRHAHTCQEIWVPAAILSCHSSRKLWTFRFRKPNAGLPPHGNVNSRKSIDVGMLENGSMDSPEFMNRLKDATVTCGTMVVLKCSIKKNTNANKVIWTKTDPEPSIIRNGGRYVIAQSEDSLTLTIHNTKVSDTGTYCCTVNTDSGSSQCAAILIVSLSSEPSKEPHVQVLSGTSVAVQWDPDIGSSSYTLEYCRIGTAEWCSTLPIPVSTCNHLINGLLPGEAYSFRVCTGLGLDRQVGPASTPVVMPYHQESWKQQQFQRRYQELEELGHGRYSIVRLARDVCTGHRVALKEVSRRKQNKQITQAEYQLLTEVHCINIVRALALFDNAPLSGFDTIVMELVRGPHLFTYVCQSDHYLESTVVTFMEQLMTALDWLHQNNIAHLDVKPENVMVDLSSSTNCTINGANQVATLKLIDLGASVNKGSREVLPPSPLSLEFAAPELVLGQPVGSYTDMWAAAVFLYIFLSGVSPFLDDSIEETTANILKVDFSYPTRYFGNISNDACTLLTRLLVNQTNQRPTARQCLDTSWFHQNPSPCNVIPSDRLQNLMERRKTKQPVIISNKY
ncbi:triple functional domain protein isoform X4 [Ctenocephalides felis]|uniref:triple functional domain protein isoform X4 n=1 Tax=Ctenocephalides felis TaxID=7515 RepID=UPI000E6E45E5|nr:triple functional domain protein isoform X4 [Ctenocephalides felis]